MDNLCRSSPVSVSNQHSASLKLHPINKNVEISRPVRLLINSSKVLYTTACVIMRVAMVSLILPIAYGYHTLSVRSSRHEMKSAGVNEPSNNDLSQPKPRKTKKHTMDLLSNSLQEAKESARESDVNFEDYLTQFNNNAPEIFSLEPDGLSNSSRDEELVNLSAESYVNMMLISRFRGAFMEGKEVNLPHTDNSGQTVFVKYTCDKYFEDRDGLVGYGFLPSIGSDAPPRLIFRGTNSSSFKSEKGGPSKRLPTGFSADAGREIGKQTYESQKQAITEWLTKVVPNDSGKKVFVSGHSLGGAIAQRVAAEHPGMIGELLTLNSPRLEKEALIPPKFKVGTEVSAEKNPFKKMKIRHTIINGDNFVPFSGGGRFSQGALLSSGENHQEVYLINGERHNSKVLSDYCMKNKPLYYTKKTVEEQLSRDKFWAGIINFIRPNIDWV
jgi:hypothetical protein